MSKKEEEEEEEEEEERNGYIYQLMEVIMSNSLCE